jgi:hypothetical protein
MSHNLSGCSARAASQIERASDYLSAIVPILPASDDDPKRQFLYQSTILMLQSYFEEYLRCVVSLGSLWKTEEVRRHLGECHQDPDRFLVMPAAELGREAQKRISFEDKAARMRELVRVIVGLDPLGDPDVEQRCVDLALIRNIIAHRGGWPDETAAASVTTRGVIVKGRSVGDSTFYSLRLSAAFFSETLPALLKAIHTVEKGAAVDPVLRAVELP